MSRDRNPLPLAPICAQLVAARKRQNIPPRELAKVIGVDKRILWNWETGRHTPQLFLLAAWCEALGFRLAIQPASAERRAA